MGEGKMPAGNMIMRKKADRIKNTLNVGWYIPLCERCFSKAYENLSYEDCIMEDDEDE